MSFLLPCFISSLLGAEHLLDGVHEGVVPLAARVPEVVKIQSPYQCATQIILANVFGLKENK
jgi:hypothetical protein